MVVGVQLCGPGLEVPLRPEYASRASLAALCILRRCLMSSPLRLVSLQPLPPELPQHSAHTSILAPNTLLHSYLNTSLYRNRKTILKQN